VVHGIELEVVVEREIRHVFGRNAHAVPGVVATGGGGLRQAVDLAAQDAASLEHAPRLGQVPEHDVAAGDVLEHRVGIDEVESLIGKQR
jgi:hypothetical protein